MCIRFQPLKPIPSQTVKVAKAALGKDNIIMNLRDELGTLYQDSDFAEVFSHEGQPGICPWRLAMVCVLQYLDNLSDRGAAEAVRTRIDWKYALSLELTDPGFDFSVLSEFRSRLNAVGLETKLLDQLLEKCKNKGFLKARGKQRTDSTHVLAAIRTLNRLELVGETLRATLNAIAVVAPDWLQTIVSPDWFDRYSHRIEEYDLPKGVEARKQYESPSTDGFKKTRRTQSLRKKTGKKSGGQLGHQGFTLSPVSQPNQTIQYQPPQSCNSGCNVQSEKVIGVIKRQVFDIPKGFVA